LRPIHLFSFPLYLSFFFPTPPTTALYTLSLHDALPICPETATVFRDGKETEVHPSEISVGEIFVVKAGEKLPLDGIVTEGKCNRSEEHTSELQSRFDLVCRLLLEKKKILNKDIY